MSELPIGTRVIHEDVPGFEGKVTSKPFDWMGRARVKVLWEGQYSHWTNSHPVASLKPVEVQK